MHARWREDLMSARTFRSLSLLSPLVTALGAPQTHKAPRQLVSLLGWHSFWKRYLSRVTYGDML